MITAAEVVALITEHNLAPDVDAVGVDTLFDDMGIDSLNRATLFLEVEVAFGKKLPPEDEAKYQTVNQLVAFLNG